MAEPAQQLPPIDKPALSVAEVVSLAEFVARRAEKFGTVVSDLEAGVRARAAETAETAESLARAGFTSKDQEAAANKAAAQALTRVVNASSETRWEALLELDAAADSLSLCGEGWPAYPAAQPPAQARGNRSPRPSHGSGRSALETTHWVVSSASLTAPRPLNPLARM